jgi:hypothetical protein
VARQLDAATLRALPEVVAARRLTHRDVEVENEQGKGKVSEAGSRT